MHFPSLLRNLPMSKRLDDVQIYMLHFGQIPVILRRLPINSRWNPRARAVLPWYILPWCKKKKKKILRLNIFKRNQPTYEADTRDTSTPLSIWILLPDVLLHSEFNTHRDLSLKRVRVVSPLCNWSISSDKSGSCTDAVWRNLSCPGPVIRWASCTSWIEVREGGWKCWGTIIMSDVKHNYWKAPDDVRVTFVEQSRPLYTLLCRER